MMGRTPMAVSEEAGSPLTSPASSIEYGNGPVSGTIGWLGSVLEGPFDTRSVERECIVKYMLQPMEFTRITVNPNQMGGVPCIRGLRIPVATVVSMVADGMAQAEILETYPDLEPADIREAMQYAAEAVRERALPLTSSR